jgi:hypothetical protein
MGGGAHNKLLIPIFSGKINAIKISLACGVFEGDFVVKQKYRPLLSK